MVQGHRENGVEMKLNETDKALYCIAWYNGYAKELKRIHKYLAKCEKENRANAPIPGHFLQFDCDHLIRVFWSVLVLKYGNYGTSPRTGWIDNIHAAKKYLESLCKIK